MPPTTQGFEQQQYKTQLGVQFDEGDCKTIHLQVQVGFTLHKPLIPNPKSDKKGGIFVMKSDIEGVRILSKEPFKQVYLLFRHEWKRN